MARLKDFLVETYAEDLQFGETEAWRRLCLHILAVVLRDGRLGPVAREMVVSLQARMREGPLSTSESFEFNDRLFDFLEDKNGSVLVREDSEDWAVDVARAVFPENWLPEDNIHDVASSVEESMMRSLRLPR